MMYRRYLMVELTHYDDAVLRERVELLERRIRAGIVGSESQASPGAWQFSLFREGEFGSSPDTLPVLLGYLRRALRADVEAMEAWSAGCKVIADRKETPKAEADCLRNLSALIETRIGHTKQALERAGGQ